jgi:hypothetical protein
MYGATKRVTTYTKAVLFFGRNYFQNLVSVSHRVLPLRSMRYLIAIVGMTLLLGCQSLYSSRDDPAGLAASFERCVTAHIADSLERRITEEEARHILLDPFERDMRKLQEPAASGANSRLEWDPLNKGRQRWNSKLEVFLAHSRTGDQLWTYVTADPPCRESGFALVRGGRVVERLLLLIAYVGR